MDATTVEELAVEARTELAEANEADVPPSTITTDHAGQPVATGGYSYRSTDGTPIEVRVVTALTAPNQNCLLQLSTEDPATHDAAFTAAIRDFTVVPD